MQSRRNYVGLLGGGILASAFISPVFSKQPVRREDESFLEILTNKAPYVFAVEVLTVVKDEIADGDISLFFQSRTAKVLEVIRGKKPAGNIHVTLGYYTKHSGFSAPKGAKLVLFLEPYSGKGELGTVGKPYVTIDPWFGVMAHSNLLVDELKKVAKA